MHSSAGQGVWEAHKIEGLLVLDLSGPYSPGNLLGRYKRPIYTIAQKHDRCSHTPHPGVMDPRIATENTTESATANATESTTAGATESILP